MVISSVFICIALVAIFYNPLKDKVILTHDPYENLQAEFDSQPTNLLIWRTELVGKYVNTDVKILYIALHMCLSESLILLFQFDFLLMCLGRQKVLMCEVTTSRTGWNTWQLFPATGK